MSELNLYEARVIRAELDGNTYFPGDKTALVGLTDEQIAYVVAKAYYHPLFEVSAKMQKLIAKAQG
jgi:hypothetical protein